MMMKNLLEKDFISHYRLSASPSVNVVSTSNADFDLKDDSVLVYPSGAGIAKYSNPNKKEVNVINFETFINSLPTTFQTGREKCDLIVYTSDLSHFLLNELTETNLKYISDFTQTDGTPRIGKRNKAVSQLKQTLKDVSDVPNINTFIKRHRIKQCCFFNKPPLSPTGIVATIAFTRLSTITPYGLNMRNPEIESYGFDFWEFSTPQSYLLALSVKNIAQQLTQLSAKEIKELHGLLLSNYNFNQKA
jgi:hypothetical protein